MKLLAFGTLGGGFLSDRWLDADAPAEIGDWSKMKYRRYIDAAGGWNAFQGLLRTLGDIGGKHGVSIANVATRWVLEHQAVAAVIIGVRLGEREHKADNLRMFSFALDAGDMAAIDRALAANTPIPGDCGDEISKAAFPHRVRRFEPSSGRSGEDIFGGAGARPAPAGAASTPARRGSRLAASAGRSASATAFW